MIAPLLAALLAAAAAHPPAPAPAPTPAPAPAPPPVSAPAPARAPAESAPAERPRVLAVLQFRDKLQGQGERMDVGYLTDMVRNLAKETIPSLRVMTRENMLVLLQATGRKMDECEGECEVDTGRRVGADLVISGELLRFGTSFKVNMKLHDTHDGELLSGNVASGTTADELDRNLAAAIAKLLAPLTQKTGR
jgi:TolB-like protein